MKVDRLGPGEVGYFAASIKDVATLVGDTITCTENPAREALPGYRPAKPMVYAGIYPVDNDQYPDLRDALEKLKLNDPSLFLRPETSDALGFGFRCGFLGLLHMEIMQERCGEQYSLNPDHHCTICGVSRHQNRWHGFDGGESSQAAGPQLQGKNRRALCLLPASSLPTNSSAP